MIHERVGAEDVLRDQFRFIPARSPSNHPRTLKLQQPWAVACDSFPLFSASLSLLQASRSSSPPTSSSSEAATCRHRAFFPYAFVIIPRHTSLPPRRPLHSTSPPPTLSPHTTAYNMSAPIEEPKAVVATDAAPVAEPIVAPVAPATEEKPVEAAAPVEETPKVEDEAVTATPAVEEKKEEKPVEPIYSGALGYKAPGLKK